jgi:gas vesicle protein
MFNNKQNHKNHAHQSTVKWSSLLAALLIGGLAGAVAMLLLAPRSGKKTRAKLQRQSRDLREQTAETMEDAMEHARDKTEQITHDVRKQAGKLEQQGQAIFEEQKDNLVTAVEAGKNAVQGK